MTRNELRALAMKLNVPRGQNKCDTITNLSRAFDANKFQVKAYVSFFAPAILPEQNHGPSVFVGKIRSYKPGLKVLNPGLVWH